MPVVKRISADEAKALFGTVSRASASMEDLRWIIPAMGEFRKIFGSRLKDAAATIGLPPGTVARWMAGTGYPGKANVRRFRKVCESVGIEVEE